MVQLENIEEMEFIINANINDDSCDYWIMRIIICILMELGLINNPAPNGDGSTYINYGNTLNMNGSFTVGGWVKNDGMDYTTIMSKRTPNNDYYTFQ